MGCDIHIVLERKTPNTDCWVGLHHLDYLPTSALYFWGDAAPPQGHISWHIRQRDYNFFWALAGVRSGNGEPGIARGLPENMSELSDLILSDDADLHSHSWLTVGELVPIILRCKLNDKISNIVADKLLDQPGPNIPYDWLGIHLDSLNGLNDFRIVFAFDN